MAKDTSSKAQRKKQWDYLVSHFTPEYIESMTDMKEYVIGYGRENKSFCYLVEVGLKDFGEIRGATSSRFGLWYGTYRNDKIRKYRATKLHFNGDVTKAFSDMKAAVAKLIRDTKQLTHFKDLDFILDGMFKYKIMYLYNPNIMLPFFSKEDMRHFEEKLELEPSDTYEACQEQLLSYKNAQYPGLTNHEFMQQLYCTYGRYNAAQVNEVNDASDDKLNRDIDNKSDPQNEYITHPQEKQTPKMGDKGVCYYPRDSKMALYALANAKHQCENDQYHQCFLRRSNETPYTEVHHLIPLCYYDCFDVSLDVPENIVSLCGNCHNEIHYGKNAEAIITKLYNERKSKLEEAGIVLTLEELQEMYRKINKHKIY